MPTLPIALTGGIAEGKTTVLRALNELGLKTASADEIALEAMNDPAIQAVISNRFRLEIPLQRAELATMIAKDAKKRRALNSILHSEILCGMLESQADIIEVPLLLETCLQGNFRRIWVVTCGEEEQLRRLTERFGSESEAKARLAIQLPTKVKCAFADRIIRTDRSVGSVLDHVRELALSVKIS